MLRLKATATMPGYFVNLLIPLLIGTLEDAAKVLAWGSWLKSNKQND